MAYTGTALVAGGFLYAAVSVATGGVWAMELPVKLLLAACAVFSAVTVAAYLGHLGMQTAKKNPTLFWVGIVVCGLVVPLACAAILLAPLPSMAFVAVAAVGFAAAMAGGLSLRMLMWIVGAGFLFFFEDAQANRSAILNC